MNHYPGYALSRLDSQAEALLDQLVRSGASPTWARTPEDVRASALPAAWLGPNVPLAAVRQLRIPGPGGGLDLRLYVPPGRPPFPVLLFFHGGGFVTGALPDFDAFCSRVALGTPCLVASVGYRLAPEHAAPAAREDALAALAWIAAHARELGGDERLALAGDSAGANLAALAALAARDRGHPRVDLQVLLCPWLDLSSDASPSFRLFGQGPWLSARTIDWYRGHYLASPGQASDPRVSPLLEPRLGGLPPALVVNAEFDVLRDQGLAYARRLEAAGNVVECRTYPGTLHDFAVLPGLFDRATEAIADVCRALREAFRPAPASRAPFDDAALERLAREQYRRGQARFPLGRSALLLIDMQAEFASAAGGPFRVPEAARRVPAMARLLGAFRERQLPVLHTAFAATHQQLDRPRLGERMPNRADDTGFDASALFREPRFVPELAPLPSEVVVLKPSYGAFFDTPLETILRRLGVETLVLAGTLTDCCVGTTARQAYERGFGAVVASDATATSLPEYHEAELAILRRAFARVLTVDEILGELAAAPAA